MEKSPFFGMLQNPTLLTLQGGQTDNWGNFFEIKAHFLYYPNHLGVIDFHLNGMNHQFVLNTPLDSVTNLTMFCIKRI